MDWPHLQGHSVDNCISADVFVLVTGSWNKRSFGCNTVYCRNGPHSWQSPVMGMKYSKKKVPQNKGVSGSDATVSQSVIANSCWCSSSLIYEESTLASHVIRSPINPYSENWTEKQIIHLWIWNQSTNDKWREITNNRSKFGEFVQFRFFCLFSGEYSEQWNKKKTFTVIKTPSEPLSRSLFLCMTKSVVWSFSQCRLCHPSPPLHIRTIHSPLEKI